MNINKNIAISVIIPVYNQEKFLSKCLDSICTQTLENIEIIIINDASTDNSYEIMKEYSKNDSRIVLLNQTKNFGQGIARNLGIDIANGEFIMFCDPDDWYEYNFCELAYKKITANNNDIVICNYFHYQNDTGIKTITPQFKRYFAQLSNIPNLNIFDYSLPFVNSCWNQIFRTDFLRNNNCRFTASRNGEDLPFISLATLNAKSISILNEPLYNYRFSSDYSSERSQTIKYRVKNYNEIFENRNYVYELIKRTPNSKKYLKEYLIYYIYSNIFSFKQFIKSEPQKAEEIYKKLRELFIVVHKDGLYKEVKDYIPYVEFKNVVKCSTYKSNCIYSRFTNLFCFSKFIRNDFKLYTLIILGIKFKFKFKKLLYF